MTNSQIRVHSQLFHLLLTNNASNDVGAKRIGQLARLRRQIRGVTDVWWHIAQVFSGFDTGCYCQTVLYCALTAGQFAAGWHIEHHFTQRAARLGFITFKLIEGVKRFFGCFYRLTHLPVSIAAFNMQFSQEADRLH